MKTHLNILAFGLVLLIAGAAAGQTECQLSGHISAGPTDDPELGAWRYELTVVWSTEVNQAVSHINLIVDDGVNCDCADFTSALVWPAIPGYSDGDPAPCQVPYACEFNCAGDPSLDIYDPLYKFEPDESVECEPSNVGSAAYVFYSDYAPYPTELPNLLIVDKHGRQACFGELTGVFPGLPCDPVSDEGDNWGDVKSAYGGRI